jgi:hypothetical protein
MVRDYDDQRSLTALVRSARATTVTIGVILAVLIAAAVVDVIVGDGRPSHQQTVFFGIAYALLASFLASAIVSRVVTDLHHRNRRNQIHAQLGILGVDHDITGRIAIVVPAFPVTGAASSVGAVGESPYSGDQVSDDGQVIGDVLRRVDHLLLKEPTEVVNYAYARRDMLLVADLFQLIGRAGLPTPLLVSDHDFLAALGQYARRPSYGSGIMLPDSTNLQSPPQLVHTVIAVGLWSNLVTLLLSLHDDIGFRLEGKGPDRKIFLSVPGEGQQVEVGQPDRSDPGPNGLVGRFYFSDVCLSVIGGTDSLGTARMGDLLLYKPQSCATLWEVGHDVDLWAGVTCPGPGARGPKGYILWHNRAQVANEGRGRLAEFLRLNDVEPREASNDGTRNAATDAISPTLQPIQ